jgi:8-oxo-dGTP pyrophosphatase MutT (NUDIX family)
VKAIRNTLLRATYRVGYRALHAYWRVANPRNIGVKCVLTRGGDVLLVRHTYGPRERWELPGGGVKRGEEPLAAARRETREELGLDLTEWRPLGDLFEQIDGKHDHLWCFAIDIGDGEIRRDEAEIADARWFSRDALPPGSHRYVERILALSG